MAYYNELDPFCCGVLKARIADGRLPSGQVDGRDVREVQPEEIPSGQVHLFAGIGGFAYAARLAGLPDDFDIWTAGFPCQDISTAGKGAGLHGSRSGLFFEIARLLRGVGRRPTWVLLENVPALRTRGFDRVAAEMEELGYSVGEVVVGAWAVGAPHKRNRVWIVCRLAQPSRTGTRGEPRTAKGRTRTPGIRQRNGAAGAVRVDAAGASRLADPANRGCVAEHGWPSRPGEAQYEWEAARLLELPLGGLIDGVSARLVQRSNKESLKAYGNSIVPQVAAEVMRAMTGGPLLAEAEDSDG